MCQSHPVTITATSRFSNLVASPPAVSAAEKKGDLLPEKPRLGFFSEPSGRSTWECVVTLKFASGCEGYGYESAMGRGEWLSRDPLGDPSLSLIPSPDDVMGFMPASGGKIPGMPAEMLQGPNLYSYVRNNPLNTFDPYGLYDAMDFMYDASNFSAGAGDMLTFGATNWARDQMGTNDAVDPCSGMYAAGEVTGFGLGLSWGGAGAVRAAGYETKVAVHGAHHGFGRLGKLAHVQMNAWKSGVKGSGWAARIPLPWR
jgi:hypothetical protein